MRHEHRKKNRIEGEGYSKGEFLGTVLIIALK